MTFGMNDVKHGLLSGAPPPSAKKLLQWLDANGVEHSSGVEITDMKDGTGWRVMAVRDLDVGETICKIPKSSLLSLRTSSLPPLPLPKTGGLTALQTTTSHTILGLALVLLHELRLGRESRFYGYLQSLPRATVPIPVLWPLAMEGGDARKAYDWLKGTEAERDLRRREEDGVGLEQARAFYAATVGHLPPTREHPAPSPFEAFAHACSLVSTRAFLIDLYHTIALCPFADLLNHSSVSHTSLASDDFVCHRCGSLAECSHDVSRPGYDIPLRHEHLSRAERDRISNANDTVDMYVEMPVRKGREVMNSYGEGINEARLLVEWAFVPGARPGGLNDVDEDDDDDEDDEDDNFVGDGMTWDLEQLLPPVYVSAWRALAEGDEVSESLFPTPESDEDESALLCAPSPRGTYHLNHAGQVSVRIFGALYLAAAVRERIGHIDPADEIPSELDLDSDELLANLRADVNHLEATWAQEQEGETVPRLTGALRDAALATRDLLYRRIVGLGPRSLGEVYDLREALPKDTHLQAMAMTIVINEMALLTSALERWDELLQSTGVIQIQR